MVAHTKHANLFTCYNDIYVNIMSLLLKNILLEISIPKHQWVPIPKEEIEEYSSQILNLINTAYAAIGGNLKMRTPADITHDRDYEVINLDQDPDIDAVSVSKPTPAGEKFVAIGHDGSAHAKKAILSRQMDRLKSSGYYVEVSGKLKEIFAKHNVPVVNDEGEVRRALKGKELEWVGDGTYWRTIGGKRILKTMFGKPLV